MSMTYSRQREGSDKYPILSSRRNSEGMPPNEREATVKLREYHHPAWRTSHSRTELEAGLRHEEEWI